MSILKKANDNKSIEYILPEVVVNATSWLRKFEWRNYWNNYLRYLQMNALFQPAWMMFETPFQRKITADIVDGTKGFFVRGYRNHSEYKSALKSFNSMFEGDGALFPRFPQSKSSVPKYHYYGPGMTQSDGGQKFKPVEIFPDEALVNIDPYAHLNPGYTLKDTKLASKRLGEAEDRFYGETIFPVAVTIMGAGHPVAAAGVVSVLRAGDTYRENPDFGIAVSKGLIGNLIERSSDPQLPQRFNEHPGEVIGGYLSDIPLVAALGIKFLPKTKVILGGKTAAYGTLKFTNKSTKFFAVEDTLQNSTIAGRAATEIKLSKGPLVNNSVNLSAQRPTNLVPDHSPVLKGLSKAPGPKLAIEEAQFGQKIGKHAQDFGLNPGSPQNRQWLKDLITDIHKNPNEIRQGPWRGLGEVMANGNRAEGTALFYRKGADVVVTDLEGNFVTILKDGATQNLRFQNAEIIFGMPLE